MSETRPARPRAPRAFLVVIALAFVVLAGRAVWLEVASHRPLRTFEEGARVRRREALRAYLTRAASGSLVPQEDLLLAVRQEFLQAVLDRSLPYRRYFAEGRYVARFDRATVQLDSGLAQVTIAGRGMAANQERSDLYVDFVLRGQIAVHGIDPDSGMLRTSVVITDVDTRGAPPRNLRGFVDPMARYFGRLKAEDWNRDRERLDLPIRVDRDFVLPGVDATVRLAETRVPVSMRVSAVTTLDRRMAVSLSLMPDDGSEPADLVAPGGQDLRPTHRLPRPAIARGARESVVRESLMVEVERLAARDSLWRSVVSSDHDVVALVPAGVLRTLVTRVARRYLHGVDVDLRPHAALPIHLELKPKILGRPRGVGHIAGSIRIGEVRGRLALAGDPVLRLEPPRDLVVSVPVRVLGGRGTADVDLTWSPARLAGLLCHGFRVEERLAASIRPFRDDLTTRVRYEVLDSIVVGRPRVQRDTVRFVADIADTSWRRVREVLVAQDRWDRCGLVMNPDSVLRMLRKLADRGIRVPLPAGMFKPFRLPIMVADHYSTGGYRVDVRTFDPEIRVEPDHLRLAFRATLSVGESSQGRTGWAPERSRGRDATPLFSASTGSARTAFAQP